MADQLINKDQQNWNLTFKNARDGLILALRTQKNFKVHIALSFMVIALGLWLRIPFERFLFLVLAIIFGFTIEMANTAFEKTVDLITQKYHLGAKIAKDVSAGMMLVVSVGLAILGALILLPPLINKFLSL